MKKDGTVQLATPGQIKDLGAALVESIPASALSFDKAQYWIGKKGKLAAEVKKILLGAIPYTNLIADWEKFYRDLGVAADFPSLVIPAKQEGIDRLIIEADGLTPQKVYDICKGLFKCWKWTDKNLDEVIARSDRIGLHAVWVKERVEADEELKNLSANKLKELGISGITFNERGLYEAKYFKETGKHLDINNWTLCSGSRYSDGSVPRVHWYCDFSEMGVDGCGPSRAGGRLRSRQVVS